MVRLGDVCEVQGGSTPKRTEPRYWLNGSVPWFTVEDIRNQGRVIYKTRQYVTTEALGKLSLIPRESILLCCTASLGEYALSKIPLTMNQQFNALTIKELQRLSSKYLFWYCSTLKQVLESLCRQTTIGFVSAEKLRNITIPLPPLAEQRRIVAELEKTMAATDKLIAAFTAMADKARTLFHSILFETFSSVKAAAVRLGDVCEEISRGKSPKYIENSHILVYAQKCNLKEGGIALEKALYLDEASLPKYSKEDFLQSHDILVNSTGTGTLGRVGFFTLSLPRDVVGIVPDSHVTRIRTSKALDGAYGYYWLKNKQEYLENKGEGATNQKELKTPIIASIRIPLPVLSEQRRIVAELDAAKARCEAVETKAREGIAKAELLRKAILKEAFE
jgi:restriction endonuclease S subunit